MSLDVLQDASVTTPLGFSAGAVYCALKTSGPGTLDLGVLVADAPCAAAALFTSNRVKAAPILLSRAHLRDGEARAIVVNSGCANAVTGEQGMADARAMAVLTAKRFGLTARDVLVASTGVIGQRLDMDKIQDGVARVKLSRHGGEAFARAMTTTDSFVKQHVVRVQIGREAATVAGAAKGAGMIHPDLATLLAVVTTDAAADARYLRGALKRAADASFNMLTIDGDTSTNDMLAALASGKAGNDLLTGDSPEAPAFEEALTAVCTHLARCIARDGEGATRLIEVEVAGARSLKDARRAARCVAGSSLVKAAVHGGDPNWGRVLAALGRSGCALNPERVDMRIGGFLLLRGGSPQAFPRAGVVDALSRPEVRVSVDLNLGGHSAVAWGCDLSEEYVTFNSAYTT